MGRFLFALLVFLQLLFSVAVAGAPLAIGGYDPVTYFNSFPGPGKKEITADFEGYTYRFKSVENRKVFLESPGKYSPKYHGLCPVLLRRGEEINANPKIYLLEGGDLYLFSSLSAMQQWARHNQARD